MEKSKSSPQLDSFTKFPCEGEKEDLQQYGDYISNNILIIN